MSWLRDARSKLRSPTAPAPVSESLIGDVIFLDVDGVLNNRQTRAQDADDVAPDLLDNLVHVHRAAQRPTVVLSTTWRLAPERKRLLTHRLSAVGVGVHSSTPDLSTTGGSRVDEILAWLDAHSARSRPWVALDDLDLLASHPELDSVHFVRTHDAAGLTRANAELAILNLRRQSSDQSVAMAGASHATYERATSLGDDEAALAPYLDAVREIVARECGTHDEPELPVVIAPGLLLGDKDAAHDIPALQAARVTHVLNAAAAAARAGASLAAARALYTQAGIRYLELEAKDALSYDMTQHVDAAVRFMAAAADAGGICLVHCQAGINRSGFLAIAHTMLTGKVPLLDALERAKRARGVILLNASFQVQLVRCAHAHGLLSGITANASEA